MKRLVSLAGAVLFGVGASLLPVTPAGALTPTDPVWALTDENEIVQFAAGDPDTLTVEKAVTGLANDENIVGMDFRPADGQLYAVTDDSRIVRINTGTGAATVVSTLSVALDAAPATFGVDFNPVVDRLRIVSNTDQNLRVNVDTGVVATDVSPTGDTNLAYAGGDANVGDNPNVHGSGYTNPVAGISSTALLGIDVEQNVLVTQAPPNAGTLNTTASLTGVDPDNDEPVGMDIASDGTVAASITDDGDTDTGYYTLNTQSGAATRVGTIGDGTENIVGLAIPLPTQAPVWGLGDGNKIVTLAGVGTGRAASSVDVTGLQDGEELLGIDVRPANGKLYGLGDSSRVYTIDPTTGGAVAVNKAPFSPELDGDAFGFDFNPTVDRLRITSDSGQNLRMNPNDGSVIEDGDLSYSSGDANDGNTPNVVASAYANNTDGAATTTLYNLDSTGDDLVKQNPANDGDLQTQGPTNRNIGDNTGFDIGADGKAWAVDYTGPGNAALFEVDLASGDFGFRGQLPTAVKDIAVKLPQPDGDGYALAALDGGVFNYGSSQSRGSAGGSPINEPVIGIANRTVGQGYWLVATDGGVFSYGDSQFFGSPAGQPINEDVTGIAAHSSNRGYWLVAEDGGVFSYGEAKFFGSMGGKQLNAPIVGIAGTATGQGYWLFAADGGVFAFGDAGFYGSAGSINLNGDVVGGAGAVDGRGYYLVGEDGGVFNYGPGAAFAGSAGSENLNEPIFGMAADLDGRGYNLVALDGGVFSYDARFKGSAGSLNLNAPIVGISGK